MTINITTSTLLLALSLATPAARAAEPAAAPAPQPAASTQPASGGEKGGAAAKDDDAPATQAQVRTLAEEVRRLKLELGLRDVEYQSYGGMGPAASKVYFAPKGLSIGGYGELTYRNMTDGPTGDQSDLLRAVLYVGYRFDERIVFNSEIEFEHAGHEVGVEFAYLDFLLSDAVRLRVGNVLVPMGFVNEMHEPAFFNGVFRPDVERLIIPTTWSENGVGVHGEVAGLRYKAYLLTGLDLFRGGEETPEADSWIRQSRSGGAESRAATGAGVLALDYAAGPATVGGSVYRGRADQRERTATGEAIRADVTLAELHAQAAWRGASARVLGVVGRLGDAAQVSEQLGLAGEEVLGSGVKGGYAEVAYDVMTQVAPGGAASLSPFVRVERYDLHDRVPAGGVRNPGLDRTAVTAGLTFKPIPTVVLKADWQRRDPKAGSATDQVNVGAGFVF
ncbi:conserved hypothetical protein [Anaeromyxobacter sp. K]|uniref:hypothetical protein n=1 Tax=Anaeromyxobacter sp. (strain K) TaxID=447217 RepID=UPI00015F99D1|nr:hypothetical protein [Anaeromyxobacter sp. K]ACG73523.1 conserved hypothetical protein [Anaeromyxobacter sp. K]